MRAQTLVHGVAEPDRDRFGPLFRNGAVARLAAAVLTGRDATAWVTVWPAGSPGERSPAPWCSARSRPGDSVTTGIPFSSGQTVEVSGPIRRPFPPGTNVALVECEAPDGVLPTQPVGVRPGQHPVAAHSIIPARRLVHLPQLPALCPPRPRPVGPSTITCGDTAADRVRGGHVRQTTTTSPNPHSSPRPSASTPSPERRCAPTRVTAAWPPPPPPSASLSTVIASSTTAVADGANSSTVTVTLIGSERRDNTVPIPGAPVTLAGNSGTSSDHHPSVGHHRHVGCGHLHRHRRDRRDGDLHGVTAAVDRRPSRRPVTFQAPPSRRSIRRCPPRPPANRPTGPRPRPSP